MKKVTGKQNTTWRQAAFLFWLIVFAASFAVLTVRSATAQAPPQRTFDTPAKAAQAMFMAAKAGNTNALIQIFGPQSKGLLSSGDPVADNNEREGIVKKYEEMNRLVVEPDKSVTLYLGAENWPFPIPLIEKKGVWSFDTARGKQEILFRRIGRNENETIDTLASLAKAQEEYASKSHDGDTTRQYAQKLMSDEGKHNGLYWNAGSGEPKSPVGPLIANAANQGYKKGEGPTPFHGYIYRTLKSQGKDAPGGAMSYMTDGRQTRGFAIVAYPAQYRNSGVMTFIVGRDGMVYQKDLGSRTASLAAAMTTYNPDKTWSPAE